MSAHVALIIAASLNIIAAICNFVGTRRAYRMLRRASECSDLLMAERLVIEDLLNWLRAKREQDEHIQKLYREAKRKQTE